MDLSWQTRWWRAATATMTSWVVWNAPKQSDEKLEVPSEAYSEQVRWVVVKNTILSVLPLGGRKDLWSLTPRFSLILDKVSLHLLQFMKILKPDESKILLTQISSALHHQPTFLEADASDVGTQHELWEDCVKFFHEHILQIAQDQRVPVCWGDFIMYPYSLLVRTSRDAVTHWMWTIQYNHWWQSLLQVCLERTAFGWPRGNCSSSWITWRGGFLTYCCEGEGEDCLPSAMWRIT